MTKRDASGKLPANAESQKETNRNIALRMFVAAVLDMSWQMAIVVLVPIIGGFELDKHLHTTPWLTVVGFVLAMAGTFVVIKRMLAEYGNKSASTFKEKK